MIRSKSGCAHLFLFVKKFVPAEEVQFVLKKFAAQLIDSGYDAYIAMSSSNLADDTEFDVQEDATKAQIKRAFVKSLKVKKLNKKVLSEFISLVA